MYTIRRLATPQLGSSSTRLIWRPLSTCAVCREASSSSSAAASSPPPPPPPATPTSASEDDSDEYTTSWDLTSPSAVSHDPTVVDTTTVTPALLNLTPRERRLKDINDIKSSKKLNRMLGSIRPARWELKDSDLKETFVRGSGNGGQAINKLSTSVSIIHLPTGIRVQAQPTRSQADNRIAARKILAEKLANLDPNSDKVSRSDVLAARARLKKTRAAKKSAKKYSPKDEIAGAIEAPADEDADDDEDAEARDRLEEGLTEKEFLAKLKKGDEEVKARLKQLAKEEKKKKKGGK